MKTYILPVVVMALLSTFNFQLSTARAQGTAFTYQGQLQTNGSPASGSYNLTFSLFTNNAGGGAIAVPVTNNAIVVTNGLFTTTMDFGVSVWNGQTNWLQIGVETNGAATFTPLTPRQELTPTPYAIYAESVAASGIIGTLTNGQLAHSAVTVDVGPGLSGGGMVGLGNTILLTNNGVLSVTGNADISAVTAGGAVTLGDTATSTDTPNLIVKRDGSGNFSANSITLDGSLTFPAVALTPVVINSGSTLLMSVDTNSDLFLGLGAGPGVSGSGNTGVGLDALNQAIGSFNTAFGDRALYLNNGGSANTANGYTALYSNTTGNNNTANGYGALSSNTNGSGNTANGYNALVNNTSGSDNVANGRAALFHNMIGNENTADGVQALNANTIGAYNTANGYQALYDNNNASYNTAVGYQALYNDNGGPASFNTAVGYNAGYNITTGNYNVEIGSSGTASDTSTIRIGEQGTQTETFIAGISGVTVSGSAVIVNSSGQLGVASSSRRFKQDIHSMDDASRVLLSLRPVTFKYKPGIDPQGTPQFGLVAEEVAKVDPDLVVRDGNGRIFTVRYEAVNAMLLNEFLRQHRTVEEQSGEIQDLKQSVAELKELISKLAQTKSQLASTK